MERRKFLIGMGSLAAGGAAATGTGALDTVRTERGMAVDVAGDGAAYLGIIPNTDSEFVDTVNTNGQVRLDFASDHNGGKGVNTDGVTSARPAYTLKNQTTNDLYVEVANPLRNPEYTSPATNDAFTGQSGNREVDVPAGVDVQFIAATSDFIDPNSSGGSVALIDRDTAPNFNSGNFNDPSGNVSARTKIPSYAGNYNTLGDDSKTGHLLLGAGESIEVIARVIVNSELYELSGPEKENELFSGQFLAVEAYSEQDATTLEAQTNISSLAP
ncbi:MULTISPECIES: hypothetical protein [Halorubrum]|nr:MULTISPECIES: hypothetical protein [Halorubrum]TKX40793.1 hypothetical protein EXE52_05250 [Halorubrum sp. CGM4_25_10-8A]TKX67115.1 hypothetical protein EXE47_00660 [Halorubrum sp. GN12_10-3_MGM]